MSQIELRISPEGSPAQRFLDHEGGARWVYLTYDECAGLQLHAKRDDEVADWPRMVIEH